MSLFLLVRHGMGLNSVSGIPMYNPMLGYDSSPVPEPAEPHCCSE